MSRGLLFTLILLLIITSLVLSKKERKKSRWNFGLGDSSDADNDEKKSHRRGRGRSSKNKLLLSSIFSGGSDTSEESSEVIDLDSSPVTTEQPSVVTMTTTDTLRHVIRPSKNPCQEHKCEEGEECRFSDSDFKPYCQCRTKCYDPLPIEKVCSSHNDTFASRCELFRERCFCQEDSVKCRDRKNKHVHVEYNSQCKELPVCEPGQLEDFPRRMREWLYNVMKDFAGRKYLNSVYLELEEEAEKMEKSWVNAVLWKFCDLDVDPIDRYIDRHELITLKAPIVPLEQCIIPFLDHCDTDSNHKITLEEWGKCLTLEEGEILDRCMKSKP